MRRHRRSKSKEAEIDITSFMNLMIVLVPVLLLGMVFSQIRILNLQLPINMAATDQSQNDEVKVLELIIEKNGLTLNYPSGILLKHFNKQQGQYDFALLSTYLQDLKLTFAQQNIDQTEILLLLEPEIDYQTLVSSMDTVRSFKAVVAASLVDAELFPLISLGDAPAAEVDESKNLTKELTEKGAP